MSNTKLNNDSIKDFVDTFRNNKMYLQELYLHSNQFTAEGFANLLSILEIYNKVRKLNVSRNMISDSLKSFKSIHKFLSSNNTLEELDMSFCNLNHLAGEMIGKGLRGNRFIQKLNLRGNPIRTGLIEIAKAFSTNTKGLTMKELDLSKCQLTCQCITRDFVNMIKNPYNLLKSLNLRDNQIKYRGSQDIRDALESNKRILKLVLDYNPIKQEVYEQIQRLCKRNKELDEIN